jgi:hypothetical protein
MNFSNIVGLLTMALLGFGTPRLSAEERIWFDAKINGQPVRLCFDSGSCSSFITTDAAQRLGLKLIKSVTNSFGSGSLGGESEEVNVSLDGHTERTNLFVVELAADFRPDFDGVVGWPGLSQSVVQIDAVFDLITFLPNHFYTPVEWAQFPVLTNSCTLILSVARGAGRDGRVLIDTGDPGGLYLPKHEWKRWKKAHPKAPITLESAYSPMNGFRVYEEAWADEILVGPVVLTGVPVAEAGAGTEKAVGTGFEETLGMAAVRRLDLIVDGKAGVAYLRPKKTRPPGYDHNRLGAMFAPMGARANDSVARVIKGGPAYEAGVRNGDILLAVDDVPVATLRSSGAAPFFSPPRTRRKLTLKRGRRIFNTTAILRDIVAPLGSEPTPGSQLENSARPPSIQ